MPRRTDETQRVGRARNAKPCGRTQARRENQWCPTSLRRQQPQVLNLAPSADALFPSVTRARSKTLNTPRRPLLVMCWCRPELVEGRRKKWTPRRINYLNYLVSAECIAHALHRTLREDDADDIPRPIRGLELDLAKKKRTKKEEARSEESQTSGAGLFSLLLPSVVMLGGGRVFVVVCLSREKIYVLVF